VSESPVPRVASERPMAALRDASIFRTHRQPETRSLGYSPTHHVIGPDGFVSRCGVLIDPETEQPADACMSRCQRNGCKQAWPLSGVSL
jgi:hypothetical protein